MDEPLVLGHLTVVHSCVSDTGTPLAKATGHCKDVVLKPCSVWGACSNPLSTILR